MMKSVVKNTPLEKSKKRLTNHSARKTVVKKLRAASVERQSIIQVTGHANEKSLNDYDEGSEKEKHQLSNIISMPPQSAASSSFSGVPAMWSFPASTSACEQVNTSSHAFTKQISEPVFLPLLTTEISLLISACKCTFSQKLLKTSRLICLIPT